MKIRITAALLAALSLSAGAAMAQKSMEGMGGMDNKGEAAAHQVHKATGTVSKVDQKKHVVTLAHGPVATLNWPAMTMSFKVTDKKLLPKLAEGSKVDFEFTKQGKDYVVIAVK